MNKLFERCIEILDKDGRGKIFNILCQENNFEEDINNLVKIYRNSRPELEMYDDSIEFIRVLKEFNIKTGLITDGFSKVQWNKIRSLRLEELIDKIIVTDDYGKGYSKPHERSYSDIMNYFGVNSRECLYIGDNPMKDFIGAKKLGMKTVRIIREQGDNIDKQMNSDYEADETVTKLEIIQFGKLIIRN
ncbi:HAD family hydrolase [Clostridium butyricum]|uniref:HAD family hydrolase n=1 Tax=Clostridium butyricum TaxID=1492 RepID=UPI0028164FED|nr:HAD family hydrolase [Clostridium butyricum]